jgi:phage terminase large subunit-like protein
MPKKYPFKHLPDYDPYRDAGDEFYYDHDEAEKAISFFKNELTLTKGKWKGQPFIPFDWAQDVIRCIFGWRYKEDKTRRYSKALIYVPRKAAKSQLISGIANYIFYTEKEPDNEIYIAAKNRDQATVLYRMAQEMVLQNEKLEEDVEFKETSKEMLASWDNTKMKVVSADGGSAHGLSPGLTIVDELHTQRDNMLIEGLTTGMGAREQPLTFFITTADLDRPSVCNDELDYAKAVRDGRIKNARYLPVIFECPKDADWTDPKVWAKYNPSYPITPSKKFLEDQIQKAKFKKTEEISFKRLYLNMKQSSNEAWLNMDAWRLGTEDFNEEDLKGLDCYMSWDLSSKLDLNALLLWFPDSGRYICRFYCSKESIERDKSGHYAEWLDDGYLTVAGDKTIDYRYIKADIMKFRKLYNVKRIGYDPFESAMLVSELIDEGFEKYKVDKDTGKTIEDGQLHEFRQTYQNYTEPAKEFEAMIIEEKLKHNSPVLDWMAANVTIRTNPSGGFMPQKPKKGSPLKIDGIVCCIMCIGCWILDRGEAKKDSVYKERGLRIIEM